MFVGFRVKIVETTIHLANSTKPVCVELFDLSYFHRERERERNPACLKGGCYLGK